MNKLMAAGTLTVANHQKFIVHENNLAADMQQILEKIHRML